MQVCLRESEKLREATMRDYTGGQWFTLTTEAEHQTIKKYGRLDRPSGWTMYRVQKGKWAGPGRYLLLSYEQPCPRGCCTDSVGELIPAAEVVEAIREQMRELAFALKVARGVQL